MEKRRWGFNARCRQYMLLRIVFSMTFCILNLFISTFLLKAYGSFSPELIEYNIIFRAFQPVGVFCALLISNWLAPVVTQMAGLCLYLLSLILLCVFGDAVSGLYPVFAVLLGFADAFYFGVNCMQMLSFTEDENRDRFNGLLSVITGALAIIIPTLSGHVIERFSDFTGYRIVFGFAAVCAAVSLLLAARLNVRREKKKLPQIFHTMGRILGNKNCIRCIAANALNSCRGSTLTLFLTMLVYNLVSSETVIGLRSTMESAAALISAAAYGMLVRSSNRTKSSVLALILVLLPCVWMLFGVNVTVLMVFSVVYAFANTFLGTPISFTYYKAVESLNLHGDAGAEVQLAADIFVAIGGVSGFALVWAVPKTNTWAVAVIVVMILTSVVSTLLIRAADRDLNLSEQKRL